MPDNVRTGGSNPSSLQVISEPGKGKSDARHPGRESDLEGLDDFFDNETLLPNSKCLTLKQAVHFFDLPAKTIKAKIRLGEIPGLRVGRRGDRKWRIYPDGLPDQFIVGAPHCCAPAAENPQSAPAAQIAEFESIICDLEAKVEAAAFRNGYLEAQLETLQAKLRYLAIRNYPQPWWQCIIQVLEKSVNPAK